MAEPVKVNDGRARMFGDTVRGGPVGPNLQAQRDSFEQMHYLQPQSFKDRLRAATRKALGRA